MVAASNDPRIRHADTPAGFGRRCSRVASARPPKWKKLRHDRAPRASGGRCITAHGQRVGTISRHAPRGGNAIAGRRGVEGAALFTMNRRSVVMLLGMAALLGRPLSPSSPGVRPRGLLPAQQRRAQPGLPTRHCASPAPVQPQPPAGSLPAAQPFDEPPERKQTRPGSALTSSRTERTQPRPYPSHQEKSTFQ